MASEAKGQIGGLDMNESSRKSLAKESRSWKCTGCGDKSNEEIIAECEGEWRQKGAEQGQQGGTGHVLGMEKPEIAIPEELRLAYKDDLERGPPTPQRAAGSSGSTPRANDMALDSPGLTQGRRQGSNQSSNLKPLPELLRSTTSSVGSEGVQARVRLQALNSERRGSATTTSSSSLRSKNSSSESQSPPSAGHAGEPQVGNVRGQGDATPFWVDVAILVVILCLLFMLFRKLV